jgi:hypothetical protein
MLYYALSINISDLKGHMRDSDIREVLLDSLQKKYFSDETTQVFEELGLCQGDARVDVAVINGSMHGYEIKSERDTLCRLSNQLPIYNRTLDYVTVVAGACHINKLKKSIPSWWGIVEASGEKSDVKLKSLRKEKQNPSLDPQAIVQLLWRDEALQLLRDRNLHRGVVSKSRKLIWQRIVENVPLNELSSIVREKLKTRKNWKVDSIPM